MDYYKNTISLLYYLSLTKMTKNISKIDKQFQKIRHNFTFLPKFHCKNVFWMIQFTSSHIEPSNNFQFPQDWKTSYHKLVTFRQKVDPIPVKNSAHVVAVHPDTSYLTMTQIRSRVRIWFEHEHHFNDCNVRKYHGASPE